MYDFNFDGFYGCKWGVSDWYNDFEEEITKAIESDEPFDTDWVSCKKEIEGFKIARNDDMVVSIDVWAAIDEGYDLIDDAIDDVFGGVQSEVNETDLDRLINKVVITETIKSYNLSFKKGLTIYEKIQELKDILDELSDLAHEELHASYCSLKENVEKFFTDKYGWVKK